MSSLLGRISPAQANVVMKARDKDGNTMRITRLLPDPNISVLGHSILALVFYGLFIAHVVISGIEFGDMPPATTIRLDPADTFPPLFARLRVACKASSNANPCGPMVLTVNYSNYPASKCYGLEVLENAEKPVPRTASGAGLIIADYALTPATAAKDSFYDVPLCYTAQESVRLGIAIGTAALPLSMVQVGFYDLNGSGASLVVDVAERASQLATAVAEAAAGAGGGGGSSSGAFAHRFINVDGDDSIKLLPLSATVESLDGAVTTMQPVAEIVEFEGFRSHSTGRKRSDVMIWRTPLVWHREHKNIRSWWDLVTNIGSAFETLLGFMPVVVPLWGALFAADRNWMKEVFKSIKSDAKRNGADHKKLPSTTGDDNADHDMLPPVKTNPMEVVKVR